MSPHEKRSFFDFLARRLDRSPSREFDRKFWAAFDREFGNEGQDSAWSRLMAAWHRSLVARPAWVAAGLVTVLVAGGVLRYQQGQIGDRAEMLQEAEVLENEALLQDLDFFVHVEDPAALSDADWDMLLEEEGARGEST